MRLQTQHKSNRSKATSTKKTSKSKKDNGPKISSNYRSLKPLKSYNTIIDLTKLTFGVIDSCDLKNIVVANESLDIEGSWIGLILFMLDALIANKSKDELNYTLTSNNVTHQMFCVDTMYGKYTFDEEMPKVYNIYNSGYYLEAIFSNENIFNAIIGLSKCLGYALDEIQLNVSNSSMIDIALNFDLLEETESVVNINEITPYLKKGVHLVGMSILQSSISAHRMDTALLAFCNWVYDEYGMFKLTELTTCGNTGISLGDFKEDSLCEYIRGSQVFVFTDLDNKDIVKFFKKAMETLKIDKNQIKFKFRALKEKDKLKEWEIG